MAASQVPGVTQGGSQGQMGRHKFGTQAQRGPVFGDGVPRVLSELKQLAQIIMRRGGARVQLDCSAGMGEGFGDLTLRGEDAGLILVCFGKAGIDAECLFEMRTGRRHVLLLGENVAQVVLCFGVDGAHLDGRLVVANGGIEVSDLNEMVRIGIVSLRKPRIQAEGLFEFTAGFGGLPGGIERLGEVVVQAGSRRSEFEGAAEVANGAGGIAGGEAAFGENGERPAVGLGRGGAFEQRDSTAAVPSADDERGSEIEIAIGLGQFRVIDRESSREDRELSPL